jgi:hypothetical protein
MPAVATHAITQKRYEASQKAMRTPTASDRLESNRHELIRNNQIKWTRKNQQRYR